MIFEETLMYAILDWYRQAYRNLNLYSFILVMIPLAITSTVMIPVALVIDLVIGLKGIGP